MENWDCLGGESRFTFLNQDVNTGSLIGSIYTSPFRWGSIDDMRHGVNRIYIVGGWDGSSIIV